MTVSITEYEFQFVIPIVGTTITMPSYTTTLTGESIGFVPDRYLRLSQDTGRPRRVSTQLLAATKNASLKFRIHCRMAPLVRQPIEHRSG